MSMLVYRKKEIELLKSAYETMFQSNRMQIRFICGEAGTGKTILADMFVDSVQNEAQKTLFISTYCGIRSEYNVPYQPFKELLKNLLQEVKAESENERTQKDKVKDALAFCGKMLLEHAPDLVGNFIPGANVIAAIGQAVFKEKEAPKAVEESAILEQYVDAIRAIAMKYKLVLIIDDLHWIDNISANLLYHLIMGLANSPALIIGCYRNNDIDIGINGEKHPLSKLITEVKINRGNVFINLDTLGVEAKRNMMNKILDEEPNHYTISFRDQLFEHTGGNPLFVSELIDLMKDEKMITQDSGGTLINSENLIWNAYPVRIEGIIQERIGRLEDSLLEILSHASVQGYNFIAQVLSKTTGGSDRDMLMTLSKTLQKQHHLVCEGSCTRSTQGMVSHFNFSNYVFQQYLYQELSMTQRMMLHSDIAGILEELFKNNVEEVAGDIARHYEMSNEYEKAVQYILISVAEMIRISAYREASTLIKRGLSFIDFMPQTVDVKKLQLQLFVNLCICIRSTQGWGSDEVEDVYRQAVDLSENLGEYGSIDVVYFGIWAVYLTKLELDKCLELSQKYLNAAKIKGDVKVEKSAFVSYANTLFWKGLQFEALEALNAYNQLDMAEGFPESDLLNRTFYRMFSLLLAVERDDAERIALFETELKEVVNRAPYFIQAVACQALAWQAFMQSNAASAEKYTTLLIDVSQKYAFEHYYTIAMLFQGASMASSDPPKGCEVVQKAYDVLLKHSNSEVVAMHSIYAMAKGECLLAMDDDDAFLSFIDERIKCATEKNECLYLADLYILKARYYLKKGQQAEAMSLLEQALECAKNTRSARAEKIISILNLQNK